MNDYGDVWKKSDVSFWDGMWNAHKGSPMTESCIEEALKVNRLLEVGAGAGHMLRELFTRGWGKGKGAQYQGFEIGGAANSAMGKWIAEKARVGRLEMPICDLIGLDFVRYVAEMDPYGVYPADLCLARGVVQHHAHWSILPRVALRFVPRVILGIGYSTERTDRHTGGWQKKGCYDVRVSPELLKVEAQAMGMHVDRCEIMMRGARRELFVALTREKPVAPKLKAPSTCYACGEPVDAHIDGNAPGIVWVDGIGEVDPCRKMTRGK